MSESRATVDARPRSPAGRCLRLFGVWLLDCCAATSMVWFMPYESTFWRDWRTDIKLRHLDAELRSLVAETHSGRVPPVVE